jgi:hypothetical protein
MDIKYLEKVVENRKRGIFQNKGMSLIEISDLERIYNQGKLFPQSLREYLFLAGQDNIFGFDYIDDVANTNIIARETLIKKGQVIEGPFFVISCYGYCEYINFVRLDGMNEDPFVYEAGIYEAYSGYAPLITQDKNPLTLSKTILYNLTEILEGRGL